MLKELRINNFAIIEDLTIEFEKGLNLITGETGSGKSIIIEALEMVLGARANKNMIRTGEKRAIIEAIFFTDDDIKGILKELGYESDEVLILSKEIGRDYPSISRINNRPVSVSVLSSLTEKMVDIFGQHEHQSLLSVKNHILILDSLLDRQGYDLIDTIKGLYNQYKELNNSIEKLSISSERRNRELELLKYQIDEIENANLSPDDDEGLEAEFKRLNNLTNIISELSSAVSVFKGEELEANIISLLDKAMSFIDNTSKFDQNTVIFKRRLDSLRYEFSELTNDLSYYAEGLETDEEKLFLLRERLDLVNTLKKKYGNSVSAIMKFKEKIENEYNDLINSEARLLDLTKKRDDLTNLLSQNADLLTKKRREIGLKLEKKIKEELLSLNMGQIEFKVHFNKESSLNSRGKDNIEFLISTNPGEALKPLSQIISGGEMSRIMLAFKGILADKDKIFTLIFDEIDTGISGRTAQVVGEKIKKISYGRQVISISHLPQIAALAETHFVIQKSSKNEQTITQVLKLSDEERVEELARLLGGVDVTETTKRHAREMLEMSNRVRK
ncbi:MAG TPA: DNA repair protein RecN [Tissierellaceae bacterium]|nr:DNA repair protein RecN [Tissierellaceae bacterium]